MIETKRLESLPPGSNPFNHDLYRMGTKVGANVTIMYEKFDNQWQQYIIVINTETGERLKISFLSDDEPKCREHFLYKCAMCEENKE